MIESGYDLAKHMSWEVVVNNYVLKGFRKAMQKTRQGKIHLRA